MNIDEEKSMEYDKMHKRGMLHSTTAIIASPYDARLSEMQDFCIVDTENDKLLSKLVVFCAQKRVCLSVHAARGL